MKPKRKGKNAFSVENKALESIPRDSESYILKSEELKKIHPEISGIASGSANFSPDPYTGGITVYRYETEKKRKKDEPPYNEYKYKFLPSDEKTTDIVNITDSTHPNHWRTSEQVKNLLKHDKGFNESDVKS